MELLDSTILIDLLNGDSTAISYVEKRKNLFTTQVNMFEILSGLFVKQTPLSKLMNVLHFFECIKVLPLDDLGAIMSADIFSVLQKQGRMINDTDLLIAGIALSKGISKIVTRNVKDFKKIKGLTVISY